MKSAFYPRWTQCGFGFVLRLDIIQVSNVTTMTRKKAVVQHKMTNVQLVSATTLQSRILQHRRNLQQRFGRVMADTKIVEFTVTFL